MKTEEAALYFSDKPTPNKSALARVLKLSRVTVSLWGDRIPELYAKRLHDLTNGVLEFKREDYPWAQATKTTNQKRIEIENYK